MDQEYKEILEFAYELAEKATDMILKGSAARWTSKNDAAAKMNSVDLVTETDKAVEDMIKAAIAERYPSHKFIGEESHAAGDRPPLTDEYTWIVDPIDLNGSFVHSNPFVACSIGVTHHSEPVVGVMALPFFNQIFSARLGGGAFLNRTTPLPLTGGIPQPLTELSKCMIGTEWGGDRSQQCMAKKTESLFRLAGDPTKGVEGGRMVHALRTLGSSVCTIAALVSGQLDMYWYAGCQPWDVCAGAIIVSEAGGFFSGGKDAFHNDAPMGEILMSRRYVFVRPLPDSETETREQIQRRLVKELYETVIEWTNEGMTT
ncbi:myo-inositol-1(or 4)-monophosphatase [Kwoniella mangroviensis CBS 10435]|uniref:Inositol-1-monophosphatase n=1 Tax=Kwoniella mangroviensis CBS 10435 TaxID=1331196 RepID=A0A1B9J348_9TREE|nr:myo-inositol-1(or 4)-monophosphatase [Kwoniella mangroviensis CBS 10435]